MVIKLTRDVQVGRMGEVIDLPYQRAIYLIRMGAALEWKQTMTKVESFDEENVSDTRIEQPAKKVNDGKGGTNRGAKGRKKATTSRKG